MGKDPDQLRAEIAETRERMGDTADAIAYKVDVPHRVQDALSEIQAGAVKAMRTLRKNPLGLFFGMAAVGFVIGSLRR